jgi:hypothetical protein
VSLLDLCFVVGRSVSQRKVCVKPGNRDAEVEDDDEGSEVQLGCEVELLEV